MTEYNKFWVKMSKSQLKKVANAIQDNCPVKIRLEINLLSQIRKIIIISIYLLQKDRLKK